MLATIENVMRHLPPPRKERNANVACLIGFMLGSIGLAIYLRTVIDCVVPIAIYLALFIVTQGATEVSWLVSSVIVAIYGYFRVQIANESNLPS
jgi:hypothetical protein